MQMTQDCEKHTKKQKQKNKTKQNEHTWNERPKDTSNESGREQAGTALKWVPRPGTAKMGREPGVNWDLPRPSQRIYDRGECEHFWVFVIHRATHSLCHQVLRTRRCQVWKMQEWKWLSLKWFTDLWRKETTKTVWYWALGSVRSEKCRRKMACPSNNSWTHGGNRQQFSQDATRATITLCWRDGESTEGIEL